MNPQSGTYTLQVVGMGSGNYTVDFSSNTGSRLNLTKIRGTISQGEVKTYHLALAAPPVPPNSIGLVVSGMIILAVVAGAAFVAMKVIRRGSSQWDRRMPPPPPPPPQ
jgi:hypothetical protein